MARCAEDAQPAPRGGEGPPTSPQSLLPAHVSPGHASRLLAAAPVMEQRSCAPPAMSHLLAVLESLGAGGEQWWGCSGTRLVEPASCTPLFSRSG